MTRTTGGGSSSGTTGKVSQGFTERGRYDEFHSGKNDKISLSRSGSGDPMLLIPRPQNKQEAESLRQEVSDRLNDYENWGSGVSEKSGIST